VEVNNNNNNLIAKSLEVEKNKPKIRKVRFDLKNIETKTFEIEQGNKMKPRKPKRSNDHKCSYETDSIANSQRRKESILKGTILAIERAADLMQYAACVTKILDSGAGMHLK
jgi:hypothetical protein